MTGCARLFFLFGLAVAFGALGFATWWLWQHRFEALSEPRAFTEVPSQQPATLIRRGNVSISDSGDVEIPWGNPRPHVTLEWNEPAPYPYARIAFVGQTEDVDAFELGRAPARVSQSWKASTGELLHDHTILWEASGTKAPEAMEAVVPMLRDEALPRLSLIHLGEQGKVRLNSLTIQPLQLRSWVRPAVLILAAGWVVFAAVWIPWLLRTRPTWVRRLALGSLIVGTIWATSFPGPWIPYRPLGASFSIGTAAPKIQPQAKPPPQTALVPSPVAMTQNSSATEDIPAHRHALENAPTLPKEPKEPVPPSRLADPTPPTGDRYYRQLLAASVPARACLHFAAFAVLTVLVAVTSGCCRGTIMIAASLAVLSEVSQQLHGYPFEPKDATDLALDAAAIATGLAVWRRWRRSRRSSQPKLTV